MAASVRPVCAACRFVNPLAMRFCGQCGVALGSASGGAVRVRAPVRAPVGERRPLTVVFCDLVGSTRLAAALDPEDLRRVLLGFRDACVGSVEACGGTVGQYLGDGVLAYFGYPRAREDDAVRALRAALRARAALDGISAGLIARGVPLQAPLALRIGIHSGLVVVADLGRGRHVEPAAIVGETTSIAARLQGVAAAGQVLISDATAPLVEKRFRLLHAGRHALAGVERQVQAFDVVMELPKGGLMLAPGAPSSRATPFLSRGAELERLGAAWAAAAAGRGGALAIEAEAGMGKTRLAQEFRAGLGPDARVVTLACAPDDRTSAYQPVLSWLRTLGVGLDGEVAFGEVAGRRQALRTALGEAGAGWEEHGGALAALMDCAVPEEEAALAALPRRRRRRTLDALMALMLAGVGAGLPLLLVVEDVQSADDSTLALVRLAAERFGGGLHGLLLVTSRPGGQDRLGFRPATLVLGPLPEADVRRLVRAIAPSGLAAATLEEIVQRTDGIPLFAEEVARVAAQSDDSAGHGKNDGSIPLTLRSALAAQLDGLLDGKRIAQLAAVIGRSFQLDVLEAVVEGADRAGLGQVLQRLVDARFLEPQGAGTGPPGYVFRHALIRDAAYESLLRDRRRAHHQRIATVLRDRFADMAAARPELLAQHFAAAGRELDAADHYEAAARRAAARSTHVESAEHCRAALALLAGLPADRPRIDREFRLQVALAAQVTATRGNADAEVRQAFERARDAAEAVGDSKWHRRALRGLHTYHLVRGDIAAGHAISEQVMELGRHERDPGERIQLHRPHGLTLLYLGRFDEARGELRTALQLYDPAVHAAQRFEYGSDAEVLARSHLGWAEFFLGDAARAEAECGAAVAAARALDHPHSLAFALAFQACLAQFAGQPAVAAPAAAELMALAEHHDYAYWAAWGQIVLGWAQACGGLAAGGLAAGGLAEGERLLRGGLAGYEATGAGLLSPYANMLLAGVVEAYDRKQSARLRRLAANQTRMRSMGIWAVLFAKGGRTRRESSGPA